MSEVRIDFCVSTTLQLYHLEYIEFRTKMLFLKLINLSRFLLGLDCLGRSEEVRK